MLLAALLFFMGVRPFLCLVDFWPMTSDGILWIGRGSTDNPNWLHWVFAEQHFVGYRPLTALSYSLNYAIGGLDARVYRFTDVGLHVLTGFLLFLVCRTMVGKRMAWTGLVAVAVYLAHPGVKEICPFIARRGDTLASMFCLAALLFVPKVCRQGRILSPASVAMSGLWVCGLLSKEVALALLPVFFVLGWFGIGPEDSRSFRRACRVCLLPFLCAVAWAALRSWVIGGVGGYPVPATERLAKFLPNIGSFWRFVWIPEWGDSAELASSAGSWFIALAGMGAVYYAIVSLVIPLFRFRSIEPHTSTALMTWIVALGLLYAASGVLFSRMIYSAVAPLALLVGIVLANTFARGTRPPARLLFNLAPQLLFVVAIIAKSTVIFGLGPALIDERTRRHQSMVQLCADLADVKEPATIYMVQSCEFPVPPELFMTGLPPWRIPWWATRPMMWTEVVYPNRDIQLKELLFYDPNDLPETPEFGVPDGRPAVMLPDGMYFLIRLPKGKIMLRKADGPHPVYLKRWKPPSDRHCYVYLGGNGPGTLSEFDSKTD